MSKPFSGPRMNMNQMNGNNRRPSNINRISTVDNKPTCSQHEEIIKYILDSWNKVSQEADRNSDIYYREEHQNLKDFKPFDLDGYRDRRLVQNTMPHAQHS